MLTKEAFDLLNQPPYNPYNTYPSFMEDTSNNRKKALRMRKANIPFKDFQKANLMGFIDAGHRFLDNVALPVGELIHRGLNSLSILKDPGLWRRKGDNASWYFNHHKNELDRKDAVSYATTRRRLAHIHKNIEKTLQPQGKYGKAIFHPNFNRTLTRQGALLAPFLASGSSSMLFNKAKVLPAIADIIGDSALSNLVNLGGLRTAVESSRPKKSNYTYTDIIGGYAPATGRPKIMKMLPDEHAKTMSVLARNNAMTQYPDYK